MPEPTRFPARLLVLKALAAHLSGVYGTGPDGEPFDLTGKVFRGRSEFGVDSPIPMLSILESPRPDTGVYGGNNEVRVEGAWNLLLQGWVDDDSENPTDPAHWLMAAVEERLGLIVAKKKDGSGRPVDQAAYHLGGHIVSLEYGPGVVRPADGKVSSKAFFYLPVRIALASSVYEPYRSA